MPHEYKLYNKGDTREDRIVEFLKHIDAWLMSKNGQFKSEDLVNCVMNLISVMFDVLDKKNNYTEGTLQEVADELTEIIREKLTMILTMRKLKDGL